MAGVPEDRSTAVDPSVGEEQRALVHAEQRGIKLRSLDDLERFAEKIVRAKSFKKWTDVNDVVVAIQTGAEVGMGIMHSLNSVVVINGVASWMGYAAKALVRNSGLLKPNTDLEERFSGEGDEVGYLVSSWRKDMPHLQFTEYKVEDAKRARLWGRQGSWTTDPMRMLMWRAWGFHFKDHWSDVLMGIAIQQEVVDWHDPKKVEVQVAPVPAGPDPLLEQITESAKSPESGEGLPIHEPEIVEPEPTSGAVFEPSAASAPGSPNVPAEGANASDGPKLAPVPPSAGRPPKPGVCPECERHEMFGHRPGCSLAD